MTLTRFDLVSLLFIITFIPYTLKSHITHDSLSLYLYYQCHNQSRCHSKDSAMTTMTIPLSTQQRPLRPLSSLSIGGRGYDGPIPSVERRVSESTEIWARDLRSLFEHARERFGDVTWESEEGGERIWAHKGMPVVLRVSEPSKCWQTDLIVQPSYMPEHQVS